ncbi:unnamed protein product [Clavelina lepadiformis]|uniref:F-box domain-containing protein n=1 Tax=Clavelina lepadiformis TaxID=159417 RepID=A0ABP0H5P4_CLALP
MPFLGKDHRAPGHQWIKAGSSRWEKREPNFSVVFETVPKSHVKKVIEKFLRQMLQKKYQSSYTNLTSAPVSKSSVREETTWLQVGLKGSKEIHGYTTLGEMIRRLDLAGGAALPYRFPYILNIAELIVYEKISNLSGTALTNLFVLIDALLMQVLETKRGIRQLNRILNKLMAFMQRRMSQKSFFSSRLSRIRNIDQIRDWQMQLKLIHIPQRIDQQATLCDLPVEVQRKIVHCFTDYRDINSVSLVNKTLHKICNEASTWIVLTYKNYSNENIENAKKALHRKTTRKLKESGKNMEICNTENFISTEEWKSIHAVCRRLDNKMYNYFFNMLFHTTTYFFNIRLFEKKEDLYEDPLLYCRRCSVLFWEVSYFCCNVIRYYYMHN